MATLNNIEKILAAKLQKALDKLPAILVNEAVNWTKDNFKRQGFPGSSFDSWPPRASNAKRNVGRLILVDTGRLRQSIRIISTAPLRATFGTDVPYAAAHNYGFHGTVNVKSHKRNKIGTIKVSTGKKDKPFANRKTITGVSNVGSFQRKMNLPRRRFIGYSQVLQSILTKKAVVSISRELRT